MNLKYQSRTYPIDFDSTSMITGDFNRDSFVDLAVINPDSDSVGVLLGNGDGTFRTKKNYSTGHGSNPGVLATADLNNDTLLDLSKFL